MVRVRDLERSSSGDMFWPRHKIVSPLSDAGTGQLGPIFIRVDN